MKYEAVLIMRNRMYSSEIYCNDELVKTYDYPITKEDIETFMRIEMLNKGLDRAELTFCIDFGTKHENRIFVMDFNEKLFTSYSVEDFKKQLQK